MTTTTDTYISVWYDETSDDHGWIVDRCDADDNSTTVKFFEVDEDEKDEAEAKARAFAERYSAKTGLPIR
jgi:hypothetical protein